MAKKRTSVLKRQREAAKRQRELKKSQNAAEKRERRLSGVQEASSAPSEGAEVAVGQDEINSHDDRSADGPAIAGDGSSG